MVFGTNRSQNYPTYAIIEPHLPTITQATSLVLITASIAHIYLRRQITKRKNIISEAIVKHSMNKEIIREPGNTPRKILENILTSKKEQ